MPLAVQTEYDGDGMLPFGRLYLSSAPVESMAGEADAAAGARAYLAGASLSRFVTEFWSLLSAILLFASHL